jgi:hypothetical protein
LDSSLQYNRSYGADAPVLFRGEYIHPFFIRAKLVLSANNYNYKTKEYGEGPLVLVLHFENKGAAIEKVEIKARIWNPNEPSKSLTGLYLPLRWRGRSMSEQPLVRPTREWPRLSKNDTVFTWLVYQREKDGAWLVPFEGEQADCALEFNELNEVHLLVTWERSERRESKSWVFPIKANPDAIDFKGIDRIYEVDLSKAIVPRRPAND